MQWVTITMTCTSIEQLTMSPRFIYTKKQQMEQESHLLLFSLSASENKWLQDLMF